MASLMKRFFKKCEADAHAILNRAENPDNMAQQAIRDLKKNLGSAVQSLAEVKALCYQSERNVETQKKLIDNINEKIKKIIELGENGVFERQKADHLALEMIKENRKNKKILNDFQLEYERHYSLHLTIEKKITFLRQKIREHENNLIVLKARLKTAEAIESLSKTFTDIDPDDSLEKLKNIERHVEEKEALAESYSQINDEIQESDSFLSAIDSKQEELEALEELEKLRINS